MKHLVPNLKHLIFAAALLLLASSPIWAGEPDPEPALGTNLTFLLPNTGEWPFVDAFKTSLPWVASGPNCFDCTGTLDLDEDGWVESLNASHPNGPQYAQTLQFLDNVGRYPGGAYTVLYQGTGTLVYGGSGTLDASASMPGRDVVIVDPQSPEPFSLMITDTDVNDPIRDIQLIMPGGVCSNDGFRACSNDTDCSAPGTCELFANNVGAQIFHPSFLNNLRGFKVIRFMDWMMTNENDFREYDEYPQVDSAHWNHAPAEIIAELGNQLGADIWVNVPHRASDFFVGNFAADIYNHLDANRKVYVEYSNEVWNPAFQQFAEVTALGCDRYASFGARCDQDVNPGNGIYCEGHPAQWINACDEARIRYTSERATEVWSLFAQAFGSTDRVVRVMGSQSGNSYLHNALLTWGNAASETDVLATAAYVGWALGGNSQVANWDLDRLFLELETVELPHTLDLMRTDAGTLQGFWPSNPIDLVHYEGGQHLAGFGGLENNAAMNRLFDSANRDPRMGTIYHDLFKTWATEGLGPLFLHYVNVQGYRNWGRFGALEYQDQPHSESPKFQALQQIISNLP